MDSAGIGELALLQTWAQERNAELKCAGANDFVKHVALPYESGFGAGRLSYAGRRVGILPGHESLRGLLS